MKKSASFLLLVLTCALTVSSSFAQATLYGVGDLTGGSFYSEVRDATKVGGIIYAVGDSNAYSSVKGDTGFLWTSSGGITAIPNLVTNTTSTTFVTASAITPDGAYIAARLRFQATGNARQAVVVTTSNLAVQNLGNPGGWSPNSFGTAISSDGVLIYGVSTNPSGNIQAARFGASGPMAGALAIPFLNPATDTASFITGRAVSSDGSIALGTSGTGGAGQASPGNHAFVWNNNTQSVVAVPGPTGNTWSASLAINPAGTIAFVVGDSTANPNGEVWLVSSGGTVTSLGTPYSGWLSTNAGGIDATGSVVVTAFSADLTSPNVSFIHNNSGWYDLVTAATTAGANLTGWSDLNALGMSSDGTLVFGSGVFNGNTEGFVLEFASGYLAAVPEPSTYTAIFGLSVLGFAAYQRHKSQPDWDHLSLIAISDADLRFLSVANSRLSFAQKFGSQLLDTVRAGIFSFPQIKQLGDS